MHRRLSAFLLFSLMLLGVAHAQSAAPQAGFDVKARQVYLIEAETGTVLFARAEDELVPAASLAKLMTMATVFKALSAGEITLETHYPVTEYAWRTGGAPSRTSTMFAALKSNVRVEDLVRGVTVQFANDACLILAEGMAGSETAFVTRMNKEARDLGLEKSTFANATGLPNPDNKVTMREMVALARHLETTYPDRMAYYLEPEFEWNKIKQRNRNPLLALNIGVTGFVTGFSEEGGYSIVAAVNRDGKHLVLAMGGLENDKVRIEESRAGSSSGRCPPSSGARCSSRVRRLPMPPCMAAMPRPCRSSRAMRSMCFCRRTIRKNSSPASSTLGRCVRLSSRIRRSAR